MQFLRWLRPNNIAHLLVTSVLQQGCCCFLIRNPVLRMVLAAPCILQRAALLAGNCLCIKYREHRYYCSQGSTKDLASYTGAEYTCFAICPCSLPFVPLWEFPKTRGTLLGVLTIRILLFREIYSGPLFWETPFRPIVSIVVPFFFGLTSYLLRILQRNAKKGTTYNGDYR